VLAVTVAVVVFVVVASVVCSVGDDTGGVGGFIGNVATAGGDVCNKIGTYLKALAASRHNVPFYVALPGSTVDWTLMNGEDIPIEERSGDEILYFEGWSESRRCLETVRLGVEGGITHNPAFDITPGELVTGLITEHGVFQANKNSLEGLKAIASQSSE
jgi:methylthioribose-1-phosphate isomerase